MNKGLINIYYGEGKGKSTASLGRTLVSASEGKEVFIIQFLKGRLPGNLNYLERLEPEVKVFRFEKLSKYYEELSEEEKKEENNNILNGVHFAKKVLTIGECDLLILDEILGLVDLGIISVEEVVQLVNAKPDEMELIMTGRILPEELKDVADYISCIGIVKNTDSNL